MNNNIIKQFKRNVNTTKKKTNSKKSHFKQTHSKKSHSKQTNSKKSHSKQTDSKKSHFNSDLKKEYGKMIKCELIEVDDYEPDKPSPIIKKTNSSVYRPPSKFGGIKSGDSYVEENKFSLESNDDFPPLS